MALSYVGTASNEHKTPTSAVTLTISRTCAVGSIVVVVAGGDSNSISLTSVTDSMGNTYVTTPYISGGNGNVLFAWTKVTGQLVNGDQIYLSYSGTNDVMARAHLFTGIDTPASVTATKDYTFGTPTYSLGMTSGTDGVQFCLFTFPFDYFSATITGWTKFADIQDGTDQCLLGYYKEVTAGSNTCSRTVGSDIAYFAAGAVLPYAETTTTTTAAPTTTTTTAAPVVSTLGSQVIGLF
jgi:hypothetical protein